MSASVTSAHRNSGLPNIGKDVAESLNLDCACQTLQPERLREPLETLPALNGLVAQPDRGSSGVFMGCDFHLGVNGPRLIEVNSNAGGAILHAAPARAHQACCETFGGFFQAPEAPKFVADLLAFWGVDRPTLAALARAVPATHLVTTENADARARNGARFFESDRLPLRWRCRLLPPRHGTQRFAGPHSLKWGLNLPGRTGPTSGSAGPPRRPHHSPYEDLFACLPFAFAFR